LYLTIKALQIVFWTEKKCGHIQRQQVDASSSLLPQISAPWSKVKDLMVSQGVIISTVLSRLWGAR
jgi:hypothetical protein